MGKVLIGLFLVLIIFIDYCCCRVASLADQRAEALMTKDRREKDAE